ncbi:MAG: LuxR family transcriptional regulator [Actinomycetota bacterium]|nr:LuxR family transcriptional regulator [Actinomycetota bacterium]
MTSQVVGREAELAEIEAFLESVPRGPVSLVVEGEAGIGKTTLWREAIRRAAARGFAVLTSRPAEAEARLSFAALADLLEPVSAAALNSLPSPQRHALDVALLRAEDEGSPAEPRAVAAGLRGVLVAMAASSPVLVAIDDTQWLDAPSASTLAFALRRLEDERVGVLAARRPTTRDARVRLELPAARHIDVVRLSLAAIHEVLKRRLGRPLPRQLLVRLYQASGGNPFYAIEIAREALHSGIGPGDPLPVPRDLRRLVRRRLARLSRPTQEALFMAALLGEPTLALLGTALESDPFAALEEAEDAEVIEVQGELIRFTHTLYAAAISAAAPRERRRRLHRRLAEVVADVEERARAEIGRIGVRRAPAELTAGELAATGLTNREIGSRLFMTRRTVEDNLARAYRKLGIRSRAELGARMAPSEDMDPLS